MSKTRLSKWDFLRSIMMFAVVVVHTTPLLAPIKGGVLSDAVTAVAVICDPLFFMLSGFFSIKSLKNDFSSYLLKKIITIIIPMILYSLGLFILMQHDHIYNLKNYFNLTLTLLNNSWWFVPVLIPILIIAPFLFDFLEALTDNQIKILIKIIFIMTFWGLISTFLIWLAHTLKLSLFESFIIILTKFAPTSLIPGSDYFLFFCLGYFYRRLNNIYSDNQKNWILLFGIISLIFNVLFSIIKIPSGMPNYFWIFISIAVFIVFDKFSFKNKVLIKIITYLSQRSYSIYLVQFAVVGKLIEITTKNITQVNSLTIFVVWLCVTILAYVISLLIVAIFDMLIVTKVENLVEKSFYKNLKKIQN